MFLSASKRIQMITIASFQFPLHKAFRRGRHNLVRDLLLAGGSAPCVRELSLLRRKVERSRKKGGEWWRGALGPGTSSGSSCLCQRLGRDSWTRGLRPKRSERAFVFLCVF